jgi:hypothetical protein
MSETRSVEVTDSSTGKTDSMGLDVLATALAPYLATALALAEPAITSMSPTAGKVGTLVTLVGSGFRGNTVVSIGGIVATDVELDSTKIIFRVPAGAKSGVIKVNNGIRFGVSPIAFTIPAASATPSLNNTVVEAGSTDSIVDANGNSYTITATNQVAVNGATDTTTSGVTQLAYVDGVVWYENKSANWFGKKAPSEAWMPAAGTRTSPITVLEDGQEKPKQKGPIVTGDGSLAVANISPTKGKHGESVSFTGKGFKSVISVVLGTIQAGFTASSDTSMTVTVPFGSESGGFTVSNGKQSVNSDTFTVEA